MRILRMGSKGEDVRYLQDRLNSFGYGLATDGIFGKGTHWAVTTFQKRNGLHPDGVVGSSTWVTLADKQAQIKVTRGRFVIFVDAGHGGLDDKGRYTTRGKSAQHEGLNLHNGDWYYEGHENRIIAEAFIHQCALKGIPCIRTYHPYEDTPLSERTEIVRAWIKRGYYGYLHSFHSNAISMSNSAEKLENTRGFIVFTTRDNNLSDKIATIHSQSITKQLPRYRQIQDFKDGDPDFEANFQILRQTDFGKAKFGAILEEYGFHTSRTDVQHILATRKERVAAAIDTALRAKKELFGG